ncbi:MAG TPA: LysM peptidoglycan-binding domain-containing protein [Bacillales bacterium]|nr:LysM peptidoglycan-binding domain-containing protein [Bacillales bacterium]
MIIEVIRRGETLWALARRYGISVESIVRANDIPDPNRLVVGQALVVPTTTRFYIVKAGDTLWEIANRHAVSLPSIIRANNIQNAAQIFPGQRLFIPISSYPYTVRPGDTLWRIAQLNGTSVRAIQQVNRIQDPNLLYPGQTLVMPEGSRRRIETNGYLTALGRGPEIIGRHGRDLTYLSPFSYRVRTDGTLVPLNDTAVLEAARAQNVTPMMVITNTRDSGFSSDVAHAILTSTAVQDRVISNVLSTMRTKGYAGLNIDFEYVYPDDRDNYNAFLQRVVSRLHAANYFVSTALAPKVSAAMTGLLYAAHDYPTHGRLADFVVLMTYEWGWAGGPPRAISPIPEMRRVLDYAVTAIPRDKILMGFSTYGRDWPLPFVAGETRATSVSEQQAVNRAARYNVNIAFDPISHAPHFRYRDENGRMHEVWYEDARTAAAKYQLVKDYQFRGASYWVLDFPFPQNWLILRENFTIRKR